MGGVVGGFQLHYIQAQEVPIDFGRLKTQAGTW